MKGGKINIKRKVFFNKKTGQPSITLPKKKFKPFGKIPKEIFVKIKWQTK